MIEALSFWREREIKFSSGRKTGRVKQIIWELREERKRY